MVSRSFTPCSNFLDFALTNTCWVSRSHMLRIHHTFWMLDQSPSPLKIYVSWPLNFEPSVTTLNETRYVVAMGFHTFSRKYARITKVRAKVSRVPMRRTPHYTRFPITGGARAFHWRTVDVFEFRRIRICSGKYSKSKNVVPHALQNLCANKLRMCA